MLEASHITITIGTRTLIDDLSFVLNKKEKIAIIGEEGDGKSTLLKCLLGLCDYATMTGTVETKGKRIGYLPQFLDDAEKDKTVFTFLFENQEGYYEKVNDFYRYLRELKLEDEILDKPMFVISGGEQIKIQLLKLLLDKYDILFLDEPSNNLDLMTILWLEKFIQQVDLPILYISHDEVLLENTATGILHLEQVRKKTCSRHTFLRVGYRQYVDLRLRSLVKQEQQASFEEKEYEKKQKKLDQITKKVEYRQETISRRDPHGGRLLKKKMHNLKAQARKLEAISLTEYPDVEESIRLSFPQVEVPRQKKILALKDFPLKIGDKHLSSSITLTVTGGEHIAIVGENGSGKTTLLKEIAKQLMMRTDLVVGYFAQNYDEQLDEEQTPLAFLTTSGEKDELTLIRTQLGNLKVAPWEMEMPIRLLSGGTKAKILLVKLYLSQANVLLLDEVTRNLSPLSNPVIRQALKKYPGVIISISHDRKFLAEVVDRYYALTSDGLHERTLEQLFKLDA